jgi:hypothetical protein
MAADVSGWLDTFLVAALFSVIGAFVFVSAIEGWRLWAEHRRLEKRFRD